MAKCKDCLHYEACSAFSKIINAAMDVEKGCEHYTRQLVRCYECKKNGNDEDCPLLSMMQYTEDDDFCSYGERREGE